MASKYDKFWQANEQAGNLVETIDNYKVGNNTFGKYGRFTIESADICLLISKLEGISPEIDAHTWLNETTFRNYSESNPNTKNNPNDDFDKYDVGPRQINVGLLKANIAVNYISIKGLDLFKITGTKSPIYNGDPIQNAQCGARLLKRMGQGAIVGPNKQIMFPPVLLQTWQTMSLDQKNERRVVAYTGPDARPFRLESWRVLGPMFKKFFEVYGKE
jgi:hypothetical protein